MAELDGYLNLLEDEKANANRQVLRAMYNSQSTFSSIFHWGGHRSIEDTPSIPHDEERSPSLGSNQDDDFATSEDLEPWKKYLKKERSPDPSPPSATSSSPFQTPMKKKGSADSSSPSATPSSSLQIREPQGDSPGLVIDEHQAKHSPNFYLPGCTSSGNKFSPNHCSMDELNKMVNEFLKEGAVEFLNRYPGKEESFYKKEIHVPIDKRSEYSHYNEFRIFAAYNLQKKSWEFHFFPDRDWRDNR